MTAGSPKSNACSTSNVPLRIPADRLSGSIQKSTGDRFAKRTVSDCSPSTDPSCPTRLSLRPRAGSRAPPPLESSAIEPPPQFVVGIHLIGLLAELGAHPVGGGIHDDAVHLLDGPSAFDESQREPVEQFRVVGRRPSVPKLSGVRTMPCPKCQSQIRLAITRAVSGLSPVSHLGEPGAAAAVLRRGRRVFVGDHLEIAARGQLALSHVVAAKVNL